MTKPLNNSRTPSTARQIRQCLAILPLAVVLLSAQAVLANVSRIQVRLTPNASSVQKNIQRVFADQVSRRSGAKVVEDGNAQLTVAFSLDPSIGKEGYRIADDANGVVCIAGGDERGLLYGVGKYLHTSQFDSKGMTPSTWRGKSAPTMPLRSVYFCTHFHNFYHEAPVQKIRTYVEELGLWGTNLLVVWYDMHHFKSFDDPEAVAFRQRLREICTAAKEIGIGVGFGVIANEAYNTSPKELRAVRGREDRGGWYECQVCPSKPEGLAHILDNFRQEFDWWADLQPEYISVWPYDQGGCYCDACKPWGSKGFLNVAQPIESLVREKLPTAKITLSTWFLDDAEWKGLTAALEAKKVRPDYVLADYPTKFPVVALDEKARAGIPLINFPDISMLGRDPWGGYGANPTPIHCETLFRQACDKLQGGVIYSEGIYEDMNKVVWLQLYWDKNNTPQNILKEYIAFEYSPAVVDDVLTAIRLMEETWPGNAVGPKSLEAKKRIDLAATKMPREAKNAWRWQILRLRAVIDSELVRTSGALRGTTLRQAMKELTKLYHADRADPTVRPPAIVKAKQ